jgi:branched-chain amino acid transport system ATP-binding protein
MLTVESLCVARSGFPVLHDLSLELAEGEVLVILGRNGAGKTTLAEAIVGLLPVTSGRIAVGDRELVGLTPDRALAAGVALVPEGRHLFASMTVEENLALGARTERWMWSGPRERAFASVWDLFPDLRGMRDRKVGGLSGGQQQMVAFGRALMAEPRVLLLDEPSFGLSPQMVESIAEHVTRLSSTGLAVLLAEQNVDLALDVASRGAILAEGRILVSGDPRALADDHRFTEALFGARHDKDPAHATT